MSFESSPLASSSPVVAPRGLHPMWIGAIALVLLSASAALLITNALFDFAWQRRLGDWNIVIGSVLSIGIVIPLRIWTTSAHKA